MLKHKEKHWKLNTHVCLFIIPPEYILSFNTPKKSLLKSSYPSQIFVPKKIPESKISNPKKSFDHLRHLKSRVTPLGGEQIVKLQSEFGGKIHVAPGNEVIMTMKKWSCIIELLRLLCTVSNWMKTVLSSLCVRPTSWTDSTSRETCHWSWNYHGCWHQTCPLMDPCMQLLFHSVNNDSGHYPFVRAGWPDHCLTS